MPGNKILVTGASGLLGREVYKKLSPNAIGTCFSRRGNGLIPLDLTDFVIVDQFIKETKPSVIVHCAAERRPDKAAQDENAVIQLNVNVTKHLAKLAALNKCGFIYISTDYVFDGTLPPYQPTDTPNPLNLYGKTKLKGEIEARSVYPATVILRVPILFGQEEYVDESAVLTLLNVLKLKSKIEMDGFAIRYPTFVGNVAQVISELVDRMNQNDAEIVGKTFHFSGTVKMTKYEMLQVFANLLKLSMEHVVKVTGTPKNVIAKRPENAALSNDALHNVGISIETVDMQSFYKEYFTFGKGKELVEDFF